MIIMILITNLCFISFFYIILRISYIDVQDIICLYISIYEPSSSLMMYRSMVTAAVTIFLSSLLLLFTAAVERESHFSLVKTAWAKSSHHTQVAPFANSLPSNDLCVTCEADKNIIRGQGLIVGTDHADYIIGSNGITPPPNDIILGYSLQ